MALGSTYLKYCNLIDWLRGSNSVETQHMAL